MTSKRVKMNRYFFVKPKDDLDTDSFAEILAGFENVDEVLLTEGDCGFIVKATLSDEKEAKELAECISEVSASKCGRAVSYFQYKQ